jgi:hypothetical protein
LVLALQDEAVGFVVLQVLTHIQLLVLVLLHLLLALFVHQSVSQAVAIAPPQVFIGSLLIAKLGVRVRGSSGLNVKAVSQFLGLLHGLVVNQVGVLQSILDRTRVVVANTLILINYGDSGCVGLLSTHPEFGVDHGCTQSSHEAKAAHAAGVGSLSDFVADAFDHQVVAASCFLGSGRNGPLLISSC